MNTTSHASVASSARATARITDRTIDREKMPALTGAPSESAKAAGRRMPSLRRYAETDSEADLVALTPVTDDSASSEDLPLDPQHVALAPSLTSDDAPMAAEDASCRNRERQYDLDNRGDPNRQDDDCGAAVFPWPVGLGVGGLAALGIAAFGSGSSGSHDASPVSHGPDLTPVIPVTPAAPSPSAAPAPAAPVPDVVAPLPGIPHLSTSTGRSTIDPAGHVEVTLASPGGRWVYRVDGDATWHDGQGTTLPATLITNGIHAVNVAQLDDQGRMGEVATLAVRVHAPTPVPTLALVNDSGASATDGVTTDGTIAVTNLNDGAPWFYRVNGSGDWIRGADGIIPGSALAAGLNSVEVYQEGDDPESTIVKTLSVDIDLTAPDAPVLISSTGTSLLNASGVLNLTQLESHATWQWRLDGGDWQEGQGTSLSAANLHQGHQLVDVRQIDLAGNVSDVQSMDVAVDLSTPGALAANVLQKSGAAAPANLINGTGYLAIGQLEPGAHWEFKVGSDEHWRMGNENGILTTRYFDEGHNVVLVRQVNQAGNAGPETLVNLDLDLTPPIIDITGLNTVYFSDSASTMYLNEASSFVVKTSGSDSVKVQFAGQTYTMGAGGGGNWAAGFLSEGGNTLQVTATDKAGNTATRTFKINYDSTPPIAPVLSLKNDTGASSNDLLTSDGTIRVGGLAYDDRIRHSEDNGVTWSDWQLTKEISGSVFGSDGAKTVLVQAMDSYNNIGATSTFHFTLDSTVI